MMDPVGKRTAISWTFLLVVGWWFSSLALHAATLQAHLNDPTSSDPGNSWILLQWLVIWNCLLIMVHYLDVPMLKLRFQPLVVLMVVVSIVQIAVLYGGSPISIGRVMERRFIERMELREAARELIMQTDDRLVPQADILAQGGTGEGGIFGSFNVKVIPLSAAELNPNSESVCYSQVQRKSVNIPVLLSGMPPWKLKWKFMDFRSGVESEHEVRIKYLQEISHNSASEVGHESASRHKWHNIQVDAPGSLRLVSLQDEQGEGIVSGGRVDVDLCPHASWSNFDVSIADRDHVKEPLIHRVCGHDNLTLSLTAFGIPPLSVSYFHKHAGKVVDQITVHPTVSVEGIKSVGNAKALSSTLSSSQFEPGSEHDFFIAQVEDGRGSKVSYVEGKTADAARVLVYHQPGATAHCESEIFVAINKDTQLIENAVGLPVSFSGTPPFELEYVYVDDSGLSTSHSLSSPEPKASISAQRIGIYRIKSMRDANCRGMVSSMDCRLSKMSMPTIEIKTDLVDTPCFGHVGFSFSIQLTGRGPWTVTYEVRQGDAHDSKTISATVYNPSEKIQVRPPLPGLYTVNFVKFRDSQFPHDIPIQGVEARQEFHPSSSVKVESAPSKVCIGSSATVSIRLTGTKPWALEYDIASPTARHSHRLSDIFSEKLQISTDELQEVGMHYMEFKSIVDSKGCKSTLGIPATAIDVVDRRASVFFKVPIENRSLVIMTDASPSKIPDVVEMQVVEGASIPLQLQASGSDRVLVTVEYLELAEGKTWTRLPQIQVNAKSDAKLTVAKPGRYRIASVRDDICSGEVGSPNEVLLTLLPKPSAALVQVHGFPLAKYSTDNNSICRGAKASMAVKIEGIAPFVFKYAISEVGLDGKLKQKKAMEVKLSESESIIDLKNDESGNFKYEAISVSDANYKNVHLDSSTASFIHRVHANPSAHFVDREMANVCVRHHLRQVPKVAATGNFPLVVYIDVSLDSSDNHLSTAELKLDGPESTFMPDIKFDMTGTYAFQIRHIKDRHGCEVNYGSAEKANKQVFEVRVSQEPTFVGINSANYGCVGDRVGFAVQGLPPWKISYSWNGQIRSLVIGDDEKPGWIASKLMYLISSDDDNDTPSSKLANPSTKSRQVHLRFSKPGEFSVHEVCHGAEETACCISIKDWTFRIHALPGARVSDGAHVIRQGDTAEMQILFTGTPPFAFTYSRFSEIGGVELESHRVGDISDTRYSMTISQSGKFQVTSVSDKFCKYPSTLT